MRYKVNENIDAFWKFRLIAKHWWIITTPINGALKR